MEPTGPGSLKILDPEAKHPLFLHALEPSEVAEVTSLARDLIRIPSTERDGAQIYEFAEKWLLQQGLPVKRQSIRSPHLEYSEVFNLYVRLGNGRGPRIHVNCHLDTVDAGEGWFYDPWGAVEENGRIYGLGAADMKGGCAAAMVAVAALARRRPDIRGEVFLACVFGEEAPFSLGTDTLLKEHDLKGFDLALVTEPSGVLAANDMCIVHGRKHRSRFPVVILGAEGRILFEIDFHGKPAHASHPSAGINAIHEAARFIDKVIAFDLFSHIRMGRGHYCAISLQGGDQSFTVPGHARLLLNRQLTLGESPRTVMLELKKIAASMGLKSRVSIRKRYSPAPELEYLPYLTKNGGLVRKFVDFLFERGSNFSKTGRKEKGNCIFVTNSVGDFNLLGARAGVPTIVFGPGGGNIHGPNEYLSVDELILSTDYIFDYLTRIFS